MRSEKFSYTRSDLEGALGRMARSLSSKRTTFDNLMNDADVFRHNSKILVSLIEEKCSDEEKRKLFSGLTEILLLVGIVNANDMFRFFDDQKGVAVAHARDFRAKKSKSIDRIISNRLSSLYSKHPIRRGSDQGAANAIIEQVNSDLDREQIKPLGVSAIRKRITQINKRISGQ
jgi:hypothetical protein